MTPEFKDLAGQAPLIIFFLIIAFVALRLIPSMMKERKEIKLADIELRREEAKVRLASAEAIGKLSESMRSQSESTNELRIFLRAVMREHEAVRDEQQQVTKRMTEIESAIMQMQTRLPNSG